MLQLQDQSQALIDLDHPSCRERAHPLTEPGAIRRAIFHELWKDATLESRRRAVPAARSRGIFTDEDVFQLIS